MRKVVAVVVFEGFQSLDAFGPTEVFAAAGHDVRLVALRAGPVRASNGVTVMVEHTLRGLRGAVDTLIVVGGEGTRDDATVRPLAASIRRIAPRCRRVASVCTGAFVLARAGLLADRRAVTHWAYCAALAEAFPDVHVEVDRIFVRDGNVWTSAGVTAGIDLALELVTEDRGAHVAREIARHLVVYLQRPGGQSQFSAALASSAAGSTELRDLLAWIRDHPDADCSTPALARRVGASPRTLARMFRAELDTTPADFVEANRIDLARHLLETTDLTVAAIATRTGIGAPETLHRAFLRAMHVTPADYRGRFGARTA